MSNNLKFSEAMIDQHYVGIISSIQNEKIKEVASAFIANIDRVVAILKSPSVNQEIATIMLLSQMSVSKECFNEYALDVLINVRRFVESKLFSDLVIKRVFVNLDTIKKRDEDTSEATWKNQARRVDLFLDVFPDGKISEGIIAILFAAIVGTWTAFEVLAEDLWVAALNAQPDRLSKLEGRPKKDIRISIDFLIMENFNVSSFMGYALKNEFKFDSYKGIKGDYKFTFNAELDSLNNCKDRSLFNLPCSRNTIVHSGGFIDKEFIEKMVNINNPLPEFASVAKGQKFPIDGVITSKLINSAVNSCVKLIESVDSWLALDRTRGGT